MSLLTRYISMFIGLVWLGGLTGCATTPQQIDPFEKFNRHVFAFNEDVDRALLKPIAKTYKAIVPAPVNKGIGNFFSNLNDVVVVTNDILQLKFKQAILDASRLLLNSTIGIFGLFDVAAQNDLPKNYEDFGQTLGYWGIKSGPYLILPLFGPSTIRDTLGWGVDTWLDPRVYYANSEHANVRNFVISTNVLKTVDGRARLLDMEQILETAALDKYSYLRNAYLQRREYLVYDGNPPKKEDAFDLDDLFDDLKETPNESMQSPAEIGEEVDIL